MRHSPPETEDCPDENNVRAVLCLDCDTASDKRLTQELDALKLAVHQMTGLGLVDTPIRHDLAGAITFADRPEGDAKATVYLPLKS